MIYEHSESYDDIYGEVREVASDNFYISRFEHSEHMNILDRHRGGWELVLVKNRQELMELRDLIKAVISATRPVGVQS